MCRVRAGNLGQPLLGTLILCYLRYMFYQVLLIVSQLFSELWVKTYLDRAVTFYPSGRVKSNNEVGKK